MFQKLLILFSLAISFCSFSQSKGLIPYKKGSIWGYSDKKGELVIQPQFEKADRFIREQAKVISKGKVGYIDEDGKYLLSPKYDEVIPNYNYKFYEVKTKGKHGVVYNEKVLIPIIHDTTSYIAHGIFLVGSAGKFGIKTISNGQEVELVKIKYDSINYKSWNQTFECFTGNSSIFLDRTGKEKHPAHVDEELLDLVSADHRFVEEREKFPQFISFVRNSKKGLILKDKNYYGEILSDTISATYDTIIYDRWLWSNNCYVVKKNGKWGAITLKEKIAIEVMYDSIDVESLTFNSYFRTKPYSQVHVVKHGGKWGIIGNTNSFKKVIYPNVTLIPFNYDTIIRSSNHSFFVLKSDSKTYVVFSKNLNFMIEAEYDEVLPWEVTVDDFSLIQLKDKSGDIVYVGENGVNFFSD